MTPKFHSLKINDVRKETEDTVSISFDVPTNLSDDYSFIPGQYLTLKATLDGEEVRRSYSLCSAPHEGEWRVAVKQVPNGKFSTYANEKLSAGMELEVMTPTGNFVLNTNASDSKSYALFAAGSGITPMLSIAKAALKNEPNSDVTLFYGNKGFASIIFREELEALKNQNIDRLRVVHILSRESLGNDIQKGRIDEVKAGELYDAFLKNSTTDAVYVCGPEDMIHGVKDAMIARGIESSKIHFELFTTPTTQNETKVEADKESSPTIASNVTVIIDGDEYDINLNSTGQNILDAAQEAGADDSLPSEHGKRWLHLG